jgi:hypothetical protein
MVGEDFIGAPHGGHLIWLPWYTAWCLPIWLIAWALAAQPLVRRYRRKVARFETFPDHG